MGKSLPGALGRSSGQQPLQDDGQCARWAACRARIGGVIRQQTLPAPQDGLDRRGEAACWSLNLRSALGNDRHPTCALSVIILGQGPLCAGRGRLRIGLPLQALRTAFSSGLGQHAEQAFKERRATFAGQENGAEGKMWAPFRIRGLLSRSGSRLLLQLPRLREPTPLLV